MPTEVNAERKRIFVSYRRVQPDEEVARALVETLKQRHHDVFIDVDIRPDSEWGRTSKKLERNHAPLRLELRQHHGSGDLADAAATAPGSVQLR